MKGKKFYIALIAIFFIGIGSIFIYRQQQEARALEFEGYEINSIESRVDALYNDEKTDINENIVAELAELEQIFIRLNEKDLSHRSKKQIEEMETDFISAKEMFETQKDISNLFKEANVVRENTTKDAIKELQSSLVAFEDRTIYYKRNNELLTDAKDQIETIEKATEQVEQLMKDGLPDEEIEAEELDALEELVKQIKDKVIQEQLLDQIESIRLALDEMEIAEELALEDPEDLEEEEEIEEDTLGEEIAETEPETNQRTEQTNTDTSQNSNQTSNTQSQSTNNNKSSSTQTDNQSSGSSSSSASQSNDKTDNQTSTTEERIAVTERYQETKVTEVIPFETFVYYNDNITAGEEIVYTEGSPGSVKETYEVIIYTNGTSNRKLISTDRTDPVDRVVTVGTKEE